MDISVERFAELIIAEHNYNRLRSIIDEKVKEYGNISYDELKILRDMLCPVREAE